MRRWLVRPAFWGLALVALLVLLVYIALHSPVLRQRAEALIEERASAAIGRPVTVEVLRFELVPLTVALDGVRVGGRTPEEPPLAEVAHVTVDARLYWLGGLRLELDSVRLDEPVVTLIFDPGSGSNVADLGPRDRPPPGERGQWPLEFALEELTINRGTVVIDHDRLPLDLTARGLAGRFWGTRVPQFEADVRELETTLPRARPFAGAARLRGRLDGNTLEILQARIAGPELTLASTGRLRFGAERSGALEIAVDSGSDFLRTVGYVDDQLEGDLTFGGTIFWDAEAWGLQGAVTSSALRVLNYPLRGLQGVLNGNRELLELEIQTADYAGGRLTGAVRVDSDPGAPPSVALDLELDGIDFEGFMADQGWPVTGVAAAVTGPFNYRFGWREPDRGTGWASLEVSGREAGGVPFSGDVPLLIENGVFGVRAARLDSASHTVEASGSYDLDRKSGRFRFEVATERVEELLPLLSLGDGEDDLWRPSRGRGTVAGTLALAPAETRVNLRLDLVDVLAPGAAADQVRGTLAIAPGGVRAMRLELLRPDAGLIVAGSLPFAPPEEGAAPPSPPLELALTLDAAGWPLEEASAWLPFDLPVDGPAYGALRLGGSLEALTGSARVRLRPGRLFGVEVEEVTADLEFDPAAVRFNEIELSSPAGTVSAAGGWDPASDELSVEVASGGLRLSRPPFSDWWSGRLEGTAELDGFIGGTLTTPRLGGRLEMSGLALAGRPLGDRGVAGLELSWREGRVAALGSLLGLVEVSGGGQLDDRALDLDLAVEAPDLPALASLFGMLTEYEFGGAAAGRLRVTGRPTGEEPWSTRLELDRLDLDYAGRRLAAARPVELTLAPDRVVVDSLYLVEEASGHDLYVGGVIELGEPGLVDLRVQSSVDPALLAPFLPGFELSGGRFDMLAVVGGTPAAPRINGQGEIAGARLVLGDVPPLTEARGVVLFYPGRVVLDSVRGKLGGGELLVSGAVELPRAESELSYVLGMQLLGVTVRYPEGWELRGDGELSVASLEVGRQVRGTVRLDRAHYMRRVEVGLTQLLQSVFQRRRLEVESTDEELASTLLNVVVSGPNALRVRNNVANLRGDIDLALRGTLASPVLFGQVELEQGGTLQVGGSDYTVERGSLTFANPYRMEPVIDLAAKTRRRDYDLSLNLSGTLDRLNASIASDPPLADLDVLGLLASGEPSAIQGPAQGAEAFLYGQAASLVTERVNRLFDLDRFRIDPLTGSTGSLSSARVTVGKQLSRDLLATYSYDPSLTELQVLQLEWSVARGLTLVATQNGDSTYAVDARWEKSF